jgi:uncharacterized membrane protein YkvA (DUF1232 family)
MTQTTAKRDPYYQVRKKLDAWAESEEGKKHPWLDLIMLTPDLLHLLIHLAADPEVSIVVKGKITIVVAYMINPLDLLPELLIGPGGFLDDVILAVYLLNSLFNEVEEHILLRHWAGSSDLLLIIKEFSEKADRLIGSGLFKKLKTLITKQSWRTFTR